jgi:hypothetical protein
VNTHCFYTSACSALCFILSETGGKIEQLVWIKFCMKLGKSTTKILDMLCEASGEHSLSQMAVS